MLMPGRPSLKKTLVSGKFFLSSYAYLCIPLYIWGSAEGAVPTVPRTALQEAASLEVPFVGLLL